MIKEFVEAWYCLKDDLEKYFRSNTMGTYCTYRDLVYLIFKLIINPYVKNEYDLDEDEITVIDNGHYQGTQIFAIHRKEYQPSCFDYVFTYVDYGSCSGCDTIQAIHGYDLDKLPNDDQVKEYMTLCLHLLQRCKILFTEEEFVNEWKNNF